MKTFKVLSVPGLIAVMYLALFAQEPQGRGGQAAPDGGPGARGGQGGAPAAPGAIPAAPGGAVGAGGQGGQAGNRGAGGPPRGGGGGGPKNVQVLGNADLPSTMQGFVQALGLLEKGTCAYCHVEDRSSDEKKPKQVARRMITMMRAINGTFPDGQRHVTCYPSQFESLGRGFQVPDLTPLTAAEDPSGRAFWSRRTWHRQTGRQSCRHAWD